MFGQQNNNQQVNNQNDTMASSPVGDMNSQIPAAPAPEPQVNDPFSFAQPVQAPVAQPVSSDDSGRLQRR
jgi:hypothetical protein